MADAAPELPVGEPAPSETSLRLERIQPVAMEPPSPANRDDNLPQPSSTSKFLRGPLRYDVDTSSPQLEAGTAFSVFVRVTNPYESPVTLLGVSVSLPTEFRDKENQNVGVWGSMWRSAKNQFKDEITSRIVEARNVIVPSDGAKNAGALETASEIVLQHGNSALKRFTLKTWRSTLFMPAAYILQFQVQYKIDDVLNQDTIRQQFNLRAPMGAVLRGACWGALVGSILHTLYGLNGAAVTSLDRKGFFELVTQTFAGILLGGVLVVAFARKKDAQPFISIEDFYGGFFVGFSAGYVGKALLEKVLPK